MTLQRHKHYQCIRAFADGWKIEYLSAVEFWASIDNPSFIEGMDYRIVPDAEGWLPWYATEDSAGPVCGDTVIEIATTSESQFSRTAVSCDWSSNAAYPITRYRIVKQHKTPQPKKKLTKYLAYETKLGELLRFREGGDLSYSWKRIPSLDLEVEE